MTWQEAGKLSVVLTFASFFTTFLIPYDISSIQCAPFQFCFEAVRFFGGVFFTNFVAIAGLAKYNQKKENNDK